MQEYKASYSDFYDDSDPEGRPYGAAKDTTTPNTIDGTPIKASMINDLFGMLHGAFVGASENASGVPALSGVPDKVGQSQFWDALKGYVNRRGTRHGTCATGGDVAVKVVTMANGIPAPYERFFVVFDEDNTADDVQMRLGTQTLPVYTGRFAAGGIGSFYAGIPYEFMLTAGKIYSLNASHKETEPPGVTKLFAGDRCPLGWLFCMGQELSRTEYAALFVAIGTIYGEGDGVTTFKLPDFRKRLVEGAGGSGFALGTVTDAGVPNITGRWYSSTYNNVERVQFQLEIFKDSAVYPVIDKGYMLDESLYVGYDGRGSWHLDASRSNGIYGRSNTVQPNTVAMNFIIKY